MENKIIDQEFVAIEEAPKTPKAYGNKMGAAIKALSMAGGELVSKFEKNMKSYSYNYASLAQFTGTVRAVFSKHDLAVFQPLTIEGGKQMIRTIIYHTSCDDPIVDSVVELAPYVDIDDPKGKKTLHNGQKHGAAITYARKYALQSILCISPDENDLDLDSPKMAINDCSTTVAQKAPQPQQAPKAPQAPSDPVREKTLVELRAIARENRSAIQLELKARKMTEEDLRKPETSTQAIVNVLNAVKVALEPKSQEATDEA